MSPPASAGPENYTRIFSGFDLAPFLDARNDPQLRARLGIAPDDFVIGKIARLFKLKGHDDLIAAAPEVLKRHPQTKFLLVGDGALRQRVGKPRAGKWAWNGISFSRAWFRPPRFPGTSASWTWSSIFRGGKDCPGVAAGAGGGPPGDCLRLRRRQ